MIEESIYSILPEQHVPISKQPHYKSKYPPKIPPTASTFCNHTTSRPKVSNLDGQLQLTQIPHTNQGQKLTFGDKKVNVRPNSVNYLRKRPQSAFKDTGFKYQDRIRPPVPLRDDKPLMNLQSNKNFVVLNVVENILMEPKQIDQKINYLQKPDFGKVPKYLSNIKNQINGEYSMIQTLNNQQLEEQERKRILLSESEVNELKQGLKAKWIEINKKYQQLTHKFIDTTGLKRAKEDCEKDLKQIEKDLEKLNKQYIFVDNN